MASSLLLRALGFKPFNHPSVSPFTLVSCYFFRRIGEQLLMLHCHGVWGWLQM